MKKILVILAVIESPPPGRTFASRSDAPYTEGTVWNITMVKVKPGLGDQYLKGLAKTLKGTLDEAKSKTSSSAIRSCSATHPLRRISTFW